MTPADLLTVAGLVFAFVSGWLIWQDNLFVAGCFFLLAGLCDMLDGRVARATGKASVFGGILDSSLDRYGDGFVLGGVLLYGMQSGRTSSLVLTLSALLGSFSVSYVRARAECEMDDCRVGFWERGERLVLMSLALLLNNLGAAVWILGVGTHWTALQRLLFAGHRSRNAAGPIPFYLRSSARGSWAYFLKVARP